MSSGRIGVTRAGGFTAGAGGGGQPALNHGLSGALKYDGAGSIGGAPKWTRPSRDIIDEGLPETDLKCGKAKSWLREQGTQFTEIDLSKGLTAAELDQLIGKRDYREFLNPRNELYRDRGMKENPPPRDDAIRLMSENPNLIRRPILVKGGKVLLGFDEGAYREVL
jgi:arsenate reductase-like glutaredoxin family protein